MWWKNLATEAKKYFGNMQYGQIDNDNNFL